jgi:hypothetical protein
MSTEMIHPPYMMDADAPIEDIALLHQRLKAYIQRGREMQAQFEQAAIAWIKQNGRDIRYTINADGAEMVLTLGHSKTVKCRDVRKTIAKLEYHSNGDLDAVQACLSTSALKHGACKKILPPEVWEECFEVVVKDKLESGEAAPKELVEINTTFTSR